MTILSKFCLRIDDELPIHEQKYILKVSLKISYSTYDGFIYKYIYSEWFIFKVIQKQKRDSKMIQD